MMNSELMELLPDPLRMVEGLRDTGYQFNTAVADVVDNSIAADASAIDIQLNMDLRNQVTLMIFDNGIGMDREALINAMKYGSKPRPSPSSLGKFGLGLKTASTAFCRKLTVVSRMKGEAALYSATWDLDHIKSANKWQLIFKEAPPAQVKQFESVLGQNKGTLVIWETVDRVLRSNGNGGQSGAQAKRDLTKKIDCLKEHLSMVYQRFLDPKDSRARHVTIRLNGEVVKPWDPFCITESKLIKEERCDVESADKTSASFTLKAYILPTKVDFSTEEAAKNARISNANQGLYIYRENRLIHGPDWMMMFSKEPHFSLLRVEFSFDHKLDEAFQIDIKKSQIILNDALYNHVLDFLTPIRRAAEEVYRKGTRLKTTEVARSAHDSSNRNIGTKEGQINVPAIQSVNATKNEAEIVNKQGTIKLKLKIATPSKPSEVYIQPVESIDDGLLWEPCILNQHHAVRINTSHPYYHKVYLPNLAQGVTIQGMDALLWGLSVAELSCISDTTKNSFNDLRYEVSRNLRKLVEDLPEPELDK